MSDFITINGWNLPILDGSFEETTDEGGSRARVFSGQVSENRRFVKRSYAGETILMTADEAEAVRGLILGLGNTWDFDRDITDYFSSRGHGPSPVASPMLNGAGSGYNTTRALEGYGAGYTWNLKSVTRDIFWTGKWTLIFHYAFNTFSRFLVRDNDAVDAAYVNGVYNASSGVSNILDISDVENNGFIFRSNRSDTGAAALTWWDNITILPYRVTDEMAAVFSTLTNTFSPLPHVRVRSALQNDQSSDELLMLGDVTDTEYVQANVEGGGFAMDNERLSFLFEEDTSEDI